MADGIPVEVPSWARTATAGTDVEVQVPSLLLRQAGRGSSSSDEWLHGIILHAEEGGELLRVTLVSMPLAAVEVVLPRGSPRLRPFGTLHRHAARPNDAGVPCDLTAEEADAFVARVSSVSSSEGELESDLLRDAWSMSERVCRSRMRNGDDRHDMVNRVLRSLTAVAVHDLKRCMGDGRAVCGDIPRRLLGRIFLDDPRADHYLQTYGGILPTDPLAAAAVGWAVKFPPGGASRFYVANVNYFHSLGGFEALMTRLESIAAAAKIAAIVEGEDVDALAGVRLAVPDAASRTASWVAHVASLAKAGDNAHMVQPYHYQEVENSDPLLEVITLSNAAFIPRYCYTLEWYTTCYARIRTAVLACMFNQPASAMLRISRRAVCAVLKNVYKLGEQGCAKYAAEAEVITGEPAASLKAFFERWCARFDLRVQSARMILAARGLELDTIHTACAPDALLHEFTRESTSPIAGVCV